MIFVYMIAAVISFYVLHFLLSLFNVHLLDNGLETVYLLLTVIIGILVYIASLLQQSNKRN